MRSTVTRQEQKQRTRQALLDAAVGLLEDQNLSSLSLREVTRAAGIVPAAFYRHFRDMDDLGVALVEASLGSLLPLIRQARQDITDPDEIAQRSLDLLVAYLDTYREQFRVIAREKYGGVAPVRQAIREKLELAAGDLAEDMACSPGFERWQRDDITMLAELFVNHIMLLAATLLDAPADQHQQIVATARRQLSLIIVGRKHWLEDASSPSDGI
jgi:AcrR family transcriptional regulator